MADITMCIPHNCPVKDKCYRFTAPVNEYRQSYQKNEAGNNGCPHFIANEYKERGK